MNIDNKFLTIASNYGYRNLGKTLPNPSVGAVIVRNNQIVGIGTTGEYGTPHAEINAIKDAGEKII